MENETLTIAAFSIKVNLKKQVLTVKIVIIYLRIITRFIMFEGKRILITGGTGSLGKVIARRLLTGPSGLPERIIIFSRDEAKQHDMRLEFHEMTLGAQKAIYHDPKQLLDFRLGDIRNFQSIASALRDADVVFNAAALKQVPACEYFPYEAVATNVEGAENIVKAIQMLALPVETVIGISTDKACKPVNVMGMTKAIQERVFISANLRCRNTRFVCVRYGNVLASRGSVIPLFHRQIRLGGPVTITTPDMTRFLLSLDQAVDTIEAAYANGRRGETFVPRIRASLITNIAKSLIGKRDMPIQVVGIRPGEKIHEILISEEEASRTVIRGNYYVIKPTLPELEQAPNEPAALQGEYSSNSYVMDLEQTTEVMTSNQLMVEDVPELGELLR